MDTLFRQLSIAIVNECDISHPLTRKAAIRIYEPTYDFVKIKISQMQENWILLPIVLRYQLPYNG